MVMDGKYCLRVSLVHVGCLEEGLLCEGRQKEAPITQRASRSPGSAPVPLSHHVSWGDSCRQLGAHWRAIPIADLVPSPGGGGNVVLWHERCRHLPSCLIRTVPRLCRHSVTVPLFLHKEASGKSGLRSRSSCSWL